MGAKLTHFSFYRLPAIAWAVLLFLLSSIPSEAMPKLALEISDLIEHFAAYSVFGFLLAHAIIQKAGEVSWKWRFAVLAIGALYGASDELHQTFVPGRFCAFSDFLADCAGVLFGLIVHHLLVRRWWFERKGRNNVS